MTRRAVFVVAIALTACGKHDLSPDTLLPQQLPGGWTRGAAVAVADVPPVVSQLGLDSSAEAVYSGPASVRVRVFRMKASTSAFELIQKWRQSEGLAAYKGSDFYVVNGPQPHDAAVLRALQSETR